MIIRVINQLPTSFRRVVIVMSLLLAAVNVAWGQAVTGKVIKLYEVAGSGNYTANFQSQVEAAFAELGKTLSASNCFSRWSIIKDNEYVTLNQWNTIAINHNNNGNATHHTTDNKSQYVYGGPEEWRTITLSDNLNPTIEFRGITQLGCKVECYVTNVNSQTDADPSDGYVVKVELIFNEDGQAPDNFFGTYSGSDPTAVRLEVTPKTATTKDVTFDIATANAKYARFVLLKDGTEQDISRTAITVSGGQSSTERPKRGVYVYNSEGLGSSIDVTVTLDAGTFEDYQLVAYFADEAPAQEGTTITKEPATLDEKQVRQFYYPAVTKDKYIDWGTNSTTLNITGFISEDLPTLTSSSTTGYISWALYDGPYGSSNAVSVAGNNWSGGSWSMYGNGMNDMGVTQNTETLFSISDSQLSSNWNAFTNPVLKAPNSDTFETYKNYVLVCELSDASSSKIRVRYIFHFTKGGLEPDQFPGTYSGSDPTPVPVEVSPITSTSKTFTITPATAGTKYARLVLVKDGQELDLSSTAISVTGGQTSATRPVRGVYLYNDGGISELSVTVSLDAGTFEDYQLVAYFADEAPTLEGSTITKEPETLDEKQIYSFYYPTVTKDKYIDWGTNSTTLNITGFISEDLPTLTSSSTTGYISWALYDGPYGSSNAVSVAGNNWSGGSWSMYGNGMNDMGVTQNTETLFSISDSQLSSNWNAFTNPVLKAPNSDTFETYKNYVLVCELSDASSSKIRVRYIFHFNADGLPPYDLVNETAITDTKKAVPTTDYEAANKVFDVSDALVSGAKYARVYVAKYGNPIEESANLTVTYDGAGLTQCAAGNVKFGWYLSEAGGIDPSKLSITGLDAAEMLKYELVIVSANEELSGTKEPAWQKKTVIYLQKDIRNRVLAADDAETITLNFQDNILTTQLGGASVSDFSKSLYAKWYILDPTDNKVAIGPASGGNTVWRFDMRNYSVEQWTLDGREYKYFTDNADRTKTAIEDAGNGWSAQIAKVSQIFVQENNPKHTSDYIGYKIVFEFCDEYDTSTGAEPAYKLKYTTTIVDPTAFTGTLSITGVADGKTQEVERSAAQVNVDLAGGAFAHSKLSGQDVKYARFYLADAEGHLVNPEGKLIVKYNGETTNVNTCTNVEEGYYIYLGGSPIDALDKSMITVQLKAPKAYKLYKVVGVFSTAMTEMMPEDGTSPLTREPDWELNYSWNFTYPAPTTKTYSRTMEWRRQEMKADASTTDADADWDTSFEELSLGQCIKWYVEDESGVKQPLVLGNSRQSGTWSIGLSTPFDVVSDVAILKGTHAITAGKWNSNWGKPAIYAPAGVDFETVKNYKIICEVASANDETATPNAKYTITMFKSYLGELKETGTTGSETIKVDNFSTSETVSLGNALTQWGGTGAKYARVWLTTSDGTRIDPTGILTVTGMTAYTTEGDKDVNFGYYVSDDGGISLADATLTAEAGTFDRYQVHVALSTDLPGTTEPDYDYEYAFHFKYDMKTKYKTVLYDETTRQCTPHLLGNWQEIGVDCNEGRTNLAANLYVRWYLEDKNTGNPIAMESLTGGDYTALTGTNGYYRYGFESSQFANKGDGTAYNPTITLPTSVTDYKNVRVVCVVTTKTDTWNEPWTADPEEMQVKYVYDLRTTTDLNPETYPFVHYQGEGYRYVAEQGRTDLAAIRDYTKVSGTTVTTQYTWNFQTNTYEVIADKDIRQNVHTVHYYYYLNLNEGDEEELMLPLQYYSVAGNDTEPRAYYRWYNLSTDEKSADLVPIGDKLVERKWGHVALAFGDDPCSGRVGVKFKAPAGFTSLTQSDEILIACDVSRYLDGMDDSFTYLVHEPTISVRYLYHILPASILAERTRTAAPNLANVEHQMQTKGDEDLPSILEYGGRIVVSTKNGTGKFSLRTKIRALNHYYVYDASDNVVAADYMQWYAYYKDETNTWWKGVINMGDRKSVRQANYTLSDISGATWTKVSGEGTTAPTIKVGDRLEMIATVGNTAAGADKELPIIWGELEIIDAPPVTLGSEPEERTSAYMRSEYNHAQTLDFNEFFLIGKKKPENSFENYTKIPVEWPDAQYGFCYPQLYGLCATNKYAGWGVYGVSPLHGDYTLLKSMNIEGISQDENRDNQSILCQWWDTTTLFDITHERASGKAFGDTEDYGAFLYVDAADEARTIAELEFDAALCANARLYYTAYVADITNGATKPQLRFRVSVEDNGQRVPVVSFVTGDISEEVGGISEGQWYQVYGYTTIPPEMSSYLNGSMQHYFVEIDNYCDNTNGADYCVDQISFFTQSAKVQVKQLGSPCDEGAGVEVRIVAPADKLIGVLGANQTKKVFYRIFKKHENMNEPLQDYAEEEVYGSGVYSGGDDDSNIRYSTIVVETSYDLATLPVGELPEGQTQGYYKTADGEVYYQFDDRFFPLEVNNTYFVSFYTMGVQEVRGFEGWGNPYAGSVCSTYSNYITPNVLRIDLESDGEVSDGTIPLGCGTDDVEKNFNITVQYPTEDGFVPYNTVKFDFYEGSKAEFKAIKEGDLYLEKALDHFRVKYPNYTMESGDPLPTGDDATDDGYTEAMHDLLVQYVGTGAGKLSLLATTQFYHHFYSSEAGEKRFAAIPVNRHVDEERYICSPLEFVFDVDGNSGAPVMELGFSDVTYPEGYNHRVVRLGLEQFHKMKDDGYKLHLPVARYQNKGRVLNGKKLYFSGESLTFSARELKISATNDPTVTGTPKVAEIYDPDGSTNTYVSTNRMYVPLDFTNCEIEFHEGYYYEVSTSYMDEDDDPNNPCVGDLFIVFKVVPEFVTWNAHQIGTSAYYSGNWYDDQNWQRSTRAELYKDDADTHNQNSVTAGHPDRYQDNGEIDPLLTDRPGFVPMKFTYVTLLGDNHSPSLTNENYAGKIAGTPQTGGAMINPRNDLASDTSPSGSSAYLDDKFIRYDMLVRYGTHANGGEGCFGHQTMSQSGSAWGWNPFDPSSFTENAQCFDVEKFYGNICKEIYFKPRAELRLQQRLTYEKAWVEEEFVPGQWYLMSTPLKGTYAGDIYTPATAITDYSLETPATVTGRQVTEAFQPITFNNTTYSRTKYPFYQRSWNLEQAKVITKTNDVRATDYSARLAFSGVTSNLIEWSHVFNDVEVPYNNFGGFAIRAHKKAQTGNALLRLPKYDTSYDYYQWDNTIPATGAVGAKTVTKGEELYGRFVFDNTSADVEEWKIPLSQLQAQGTDGEGYTYYLVGNPFMASIDMGRFFGYLDVDGKYYSYNPSLSPVYYTYNQGAMTATDATVTAAVIRPLQAFIVKCRASEAPENVVFNRWAITDGNFTAPTLYVPEDNGNDPAPAPELLTLRATSSQGSSVTTIALSPQANNDFVDGEDATALLDTNLSDVPMVFTIAGSHALSIDRRSSVDMVPFAVSSSNDEAVEITVDVDSLYVYDALTNESVTVGDGSTVTVQSNDYGRYFLTSTKASPLTLSHGEGADVLISVRGRQVTVTASADLQQVRAFSVSGATVYQTSHPGTTCQFQLQQGTYVIETETLDGRKTMKVLVK